MVATGRDLHNRVRAQGTEVDLSDFVLDRTLIVRVLATRCSSFEITTDARCVASPGEHAAISRQQERVELRESHLTHEVLGTSHLKAMQGFKSLSDQVHFSQSCLIVDDFAGTPRSVLCLFALAPVLLCLFVVLACACRH